MYLGAFAWMAFVALAALKVFDTERADAPFPAALGLTLFATMFAMSLAPKVAGLLDVLLRAGEPSGCAVRDDAYRGKQP